MAELKYRPEIDGLRAIAVLAVVLFHAGLGISGGYVGVDVFFVISGFLITRIILREIENGSFSLAGFWERRIRRIFPALFVMVCTTLGVGYYLLLPAELEKLGKSSVSQTALLANVYFWRDTGYFAGPAETKPLLHTWSLAVEEQFYLFFPLLLVVFKNQSRRNLFWSLVTLTGMSFIASLYGTHFHPSGTFFLLPTRAWELLVGVLLAVGRSPSVSRPSLDRILGLAGLAAILLPALLYDKQTSFPGLAALPPVAGTAAILYATAATPGTIVGRLLSLRPLVFVGLISYSMYLWHWPAMTYVRYYFGHFHWMQAAIVLPCTLFCAIASWKCIEQPFIRKKILRSRPRLFISAVSINGAVAALSIFFVTSHGMPGRYPTPVETFVRNDKETLAEDVIWMGVEYVEPNVTPFRIEAMPALGANAEQSSEGKKDLLVWGDSHAMMLGKVIDECASEAGLSVRYVAASALVPCPGVFTSHKDDFRNRDAVMQAMAENPPQNLLLVARWNLYTGGVTEFDPELTSPSEFLVSDDTHASKNGVESADVLRRALDRLVAFCGQRGINLWILKQVPEIGEIYTARDVYLWKMGQRDTLPNHRISVAQHEQRQSLPNQIFASMNSSAVRICDPAPFLFDKDGLTINYRKGRSCYRDNDHLTRWGAELLKPFFKEMFSEMKLREINVRGNGS